MQGPEDVAETKKPPKGGKTKARRPSKKPTARGVAKPAKKATKPPAKAKPGAEEQADAPLRKSKRAAAPNPLYSDAALLDDGDVIELEAEEAVKKKRKTEAHPIKWSKDALEDEDEVDRLTRERLKHMTKLTPLLNRVKKMTNIPKLESFVRVLRQGGAGEHSQEVLEATLDKLQEVREKKSKK
ncbi:unnamed protein product [Pedinophyceae sp. YPF-701]|nr:unnamed protein product [Pedinophyceae sp. YPF-701]